MSAFERRRKISVALACRIDLEGFKTARVNSLGLSVEIKEDFFAIGSPLVFDLVAF